MKTYTSHSLDETREIAAQWLASIIEQADGKEVDSISQATVVGLSGHLGAGKTAFVKMVAKTLGIQEEVTSPTFVIMKIYEVQSPKSKVQSWKSKEGVPWKRLVHIDAYRLEKPEELEVLNWEQLVADPHNLIMVEWSENVELDKLIPTHQKIRFKIVNNEYRIYVDELR